jgi:hypothetical protein
MESAAEKGEGYGVHEVAVLSRTTSAGATEAKEDYIDGPWKDGTDRPAAEHVVLSHAMPARAIRANSGERRIIDVRSIEECTIEQWVQVQREHQKGSI